MKTLPAIFVAMFVHNVAADGISIDPISGIDLGNKKISNLAAPGLASDAATKGYSDNQIGSHATNSSAHHARYSDGEAVAAVLANDGSGSNLDADTLDGYDSSSFRLDYGYGGNIPIPVGSLFLNNATLGRWGVTLPANGTSSFTLNLVIPRDIYYYNTIYGSSLIVEIMVHYPGSAGACQAVIQPESTAHYLSVQFQDGYYNSGVDTVDFPPFIGANSSILHRYTLDPAPPERPLFFEIFRYGSDPADNCGDVNLAGILIRYPRQGQSNTTW